MKSAKSKSKRRLEKPAREHFTVSLPTDEARRLRFFAAEAGLTPERFLEGYCPILIRECIEDMEFAGREV